MRKILMAGAAAATLIGGTSVSLAPAMAQGNHMHGDHDRGGHFEGRSEGRRDFRGFRGDRGDRDRFDGDDLAFGLFGFGLGAAAANPYYYGYDYGPGYYYGPDYDNDDYGYYGNCYSRRWVWNPYYGRYVLERVRYAC